MDFLLNVDVNSNRGTELLVSWIQDVRGKIEDSSLGVNIDLSRCSFFQPIHMVLLACLIEEVYQKEETVVQFEPPKNRTALQYLENVRFFEYWNEGFNRKKYTKTKIDTSLCLWQIAQDMIDSYAIEARNHASNNWLSDRDTSPIHLTMTELFNNVIDHSNCNEKAYSHIQYYPNICELRICVGDFGIGLAQKIIEYFEDENLEERSAVIRAFDKGFSTKSTPQNRGLGLDNIMTFANNFNGKIEVYCNSVAYHYSAENKQTIINDLDVNFEGTLIQITLSTINLEHGYLEELNEEFDLF